MSSAMAKSNLTSSRNPFTPVRKFFLRFDPFKLSNPQLGKRSRDSYNDPHSSTHRHLLSQDSPDRSSALCSSPSVALQHEDTTEDAIIITALEVAPFCCHEDLVTMSRSQLLDVAAALNAKLPSSLYVDANSARPNREIRHDIEDVVGMRRVRVLPNAPKPSRHAHSNAVDLGKSPPTSPLAMRSRMRERYGTLGAPRLARLVEEEDDESTEMEVELELDRPIKRRKVTPPTLKEDLAAAKDTNSNRTIGRRGQHPLKRAVSYPVSRLSARPQRVLRSHSQKLPRELKLMNIDTSFVTTTRPRYRACFGKGPPNATTAQSKVQDVDQGTNHTVHLSGTYRSSLNRKLSVSSTINTGSSPTSVATFKTAASTISSDTGVRKRRRSGTEDEVAFGFNGMNMGSTTLEMDICI